MSSFLIVLIQPQCRAQSRLFPGSYLEKIEKETEFIKQFSERIVPENNELFIQEMSSGEPAPTPQSGLSDLAPSISFDPLELLSTDGEASHNTSEADSLGASHSSSDSCPIESVSSDNQETSQPPTTTTVREFKILGSQVFSQNTWNERLASYLLCGDLSFEDIQMVRSRVDQYFVENGYVTTGSYIPIQSIAQNTETVEIQVVEGSLEAIHITGTRRLNPSYIRNRINLAVSTPLHIPSLIDSLQLLQQDPLIETISAELSASPRRGQSILNIDIVEAETFKLQLLTDNSRSPSVGSFRRQVQLEQRNLFGQGDTLNLAYTNTRGSNGFDISYAYPLNARNGQLLLGYGQTASQIVEAPFSLLDIESDSLYYDISFQQPIIQTPNTELSLGAAFTRRESSNVFLEDVIGRSVPFLSSGSDDKGKTQVLALRLTQDWTQRGSRQVLALRSQLSFGLGGNQPALAVDSPGTQFVAWRGQGQWTTLLAPETIFNLHADVQIADRRLVPSEQFTLGGQDSVRGYRQNYLLTDSGALLGAELAVPVFRNSSIPGDLSFISFADIGTGWNSRGNTPESNTLASIGVGLDWQQSDNLAARVEWGVPLISVPTRGSSLQESGFYFSISYSPSF